VQDLGAYHVRANVFFADLNKFSIPRPRSSTSAAHGDLGADGRRAGRTAGAGGVRTFSLLSNRFPDHTKLYVRVEDKSTGAVYSTYPLGRVIAYDEPQVELDSQTTTRSPLRGAADMGLFAHQLERPAPRALEVHGNQDASAVATRRGWRDCRRGGMLDVPVAPSAQKAGSKLSARPAATPADD
jgi:hypothetical protein